MELEYARASQWTMPVHLHGLNVRAFRATYPSAS